jgi:hypothetical protein
MKCRSKKKKNISKVKLRSYQPNIIFHVTTPAPGEPSSPDSNEISLDEPQTIEVRQGPSHHTGLSPDFQAVLEELKLMNKRLRENIIKQEQREEWQFAARVIDRLFFFISSFIFFVCVSGIFILMAADHTTHD